jgi:CheY-like chemotaxis protein
MVVSGDDVQHRALEMGAAAVLRKPVSAPELDAALGALMAKATRGRASLLVVEDDEVQRTAVAELLGGDDIEIVVAGTGAEALEAVERQRFDCVVLDLSLPDMPGLDLLRALQASADGIALPVVIHTGADLTAEEEAALSHLSERIIVKDGCSPGRLLNETALFLHRAEANLPEAARALMRETDLHDPLLYGRRLLIVDDDMRNIFALSAALERYGVIITYAENGRAAIEQLEATPDVDVVLMDIMMPEMDGYETMRHIREDHRFTRLPIIALTANAMKGDRERCIDAGASDYIPKPVSVQHLLSQLRVQLRQSTAVPA